MEERHEAGQATFEEVKERSADRLAEPQVGPKVREYCSPGCATAFLEIRDGYVDTGAAPGKDTRWHDVAQMKPQTTTKEEVAARRRRKLLWIIPYGRVGTPGRQGRHQRRSSPKPPAGRATAHHRAHAEVKK